MISPELVRQTRVSLGLTQQTLARESGLSQSLVAKIERGKTKPSFEAMRRIDEVLARPARASRRTAKEFVKHALVSCESGERISDVMQRMGAHHYSQLPVIDGGVLVGVVTERELLRGMVEKRSVVGEIMGPTPPVIAKDAPEQLLYALLDHVAIVLVQDRGKFIGVITKSDVFRVLRKEQ